MPVPFRDARREESSPEAGYLRFMQEERGRGIRGALFLINARGEPVDFAYSRIDLPALVLWRSGDARRHALAGLSAVLFDASLRAPALLLALADEVPADLFTDELLVDIPLCRVHADMAKRYLPIRTGDLEESPAAPMVTWVGDAPVGASPGNRLLEMLTARDLLAEPFARAAAGLEEAYR
ncbi:MAG: hypothetical protein ACR2OO_03305, partial [Thermomicrobiales bacterium]